MVDKSAPNIPANLNAICNVDGSVSASWDAATDVGCKGLHSSPYWAQAGTDPTFATAYSDSSWANGWTAETTDKSTNAGAFSAGSTVYVHVRARDGFDQQSGFSLVNASCVVPIPTPTPTSIPPSPTPTPTIGAWFKLKDSSFNSRQSPRQNGVPNSAQMYDADDSANNYILSGKSGLLVQNVALNPGTNALDGTGKPIYSQNNWYTNAYQSVDDITYSKYIEYIKARKDFKTVTTLPLTNVSFPTDGVYSVPGGITLSDTSIFNGKNIVLVVDGTVTFSKKNIATTTFIPATGSIAVLAKNITIDPDVTEIDAILIGQTVTLDEAAIGLKIKGNLIDEDAAGLDLTRTQVNPNKPALFVVFDPKMYLDVLPYLSTSTYDWRQIQ